MLRLELEGRRPGGRSKRRLMKDMKSVGVRKRGGGADDRAAGDWLW